MVWAFITNSVVTVLTMETKFLTPKVHHAKHSQKYLPGNFQLNISQKIHAGVFSKWI